MEATSHYRPERDSIRLKAFQFAALEYALFRSNIQSVLWVVFTDDEFTALLTYYDSAGSGVVDGYFFLKSFTRLSAIRKEREAVEIKERQDAFEARRKEEEELKELAKERKHTLKIIWEFPQEVKDIALKKLETAAKAFDPGHPAAPSTAGFNVNAVKPNVFREMLKLTLNLRVNAAELGAILKEFRPDITDGPIPASDFLKFFYRLGFEARDHERQLQRKRQEELDKKAEEERLRKIEDAKRKLKTFVDYNFSESDETSALEKLRGASEKYDKTAPGAVALDGFECEELIPLDFRELLKRVFNIALSPTELGYVIQRYDTKRTGNVHCKSFITEFLRIGNEERHKHHMEQLERQRKLIEEAEKEHIEKMKAVQKSERVPMSQTFADSDLQSALHKLTLVAAFFDKTRGAGLQSFEPQSLNLVQFKRALKRTFDITFTAAEMGAIVKHLQKNEQGEILCHPFLTLFIQLGTAERDRLRTEQMNRQRELDEKASKEAQQRQAEKDSKVLYEVDYEYAEEHLDAAIEKMTEAARRYDASHPASVGLNSFDQKSMTGAEFKEVVRRTFHLHFSPKETGAILGFFNRRQAASTGKKQPHDQIDCGEYLKYFLQLGVAERGRLHSEQLERQRREDQERQEEHERKVRETATRGTYEPDMNFTAEDKASIQAKLLIAAEKFDKSHPASPSLEAFTASHMSPGVFRENIKSCFGVKATRKEIGYLLSVYDKDGIGQINTKEFLIKFFAVGKKARDEKRVKALEEQREAQKQMQKEEEMKLQQLVEKSDFELDHDFTPDDFNQAVKRMTVASEKYDKTHPSAPNLDGFTGGPLAPGAFRELMKRAFTIYLSAREVTAILDRFHMETTREFLDGKKFLIFFMRLGFDARARRKTSNLQLLRKHTEQRKVEEERRLRVALQRVEFELPKSFSETDRDSALLKVTQAAMLYDKNAPGAASLDCFNELYLLPAIFREVLKRTFGINLTPNETAALTKEFQFQSSDNVDTQKFLVFFIKTGFEERDKFKALELEKQRRSEYVRQKEEEKKQKDADAKMALTINYHYSREQREAAFQKLAHAAKKYDKTHPAAMSLDGFEQKTMEPTVFREMIKRTFGLVLEPEELGALIHFFDQQNKGSINSYNFLTYFLKLGITERERDHRQSMQKLREDAAFREKFHQEKMAAQWAKAELSVVSDFAEEDATRAWEMLTVAASKFDASSSSGAMGLAAFQTATMTPGVFREMLKRCFDLRFTNGELASLIARFARKDGDDARATGKAAPASASASERPHTASSAAGGPVEIDCNLFMVLFTQIGAERRYQIRAAQIAKQRSMSKRAESEARAMREAMDKAADMALLNKASETFSDQDFRHALEKIRELAANYDRTHPSAPSLKGFQGADMTPSEFQNMMQRTFHTFFPPTEIAALLTTFPVQQSEKESKRHKQKRSAGAEDGSRPATAAAVQSLAQEQQIVRISNAAFLAHFHRINRQEQAKKDQIRIEKEKVMLAKSKKEHDEAMRSAVRERMTRLQYRVPDDENTCVDKIKAMAQEFCIDSAPYIEGLRSLKGPAWPADKLRSLLDSIFHIKLTFAEMGVLRDALAGDIASVDRASGETVFDGPRLLKWFYALSRLEEQAMLYQLDKSRHRGGLATAPAPTGSKANMMRASLGHGHGHAGGHGPAANVGVGGVEGEREGEGERDDDDVAPRGVTLDTMRELGRPSQISLTATTATTTATATANYTRASTAASASSIRSHSHPTTVAASGRSKAAPKSTPAPPPIAPQTSFSHGVSPPSSSHSQRRQQSAGSTATGAGGAALSDVDSIASFTKSIVKDQHWFLSLPVESNSPSNVATATAAASSRSHADHVHQHLSQLFQNQRSIANYDPELAKQLQGGPSHPPSSKQPLSESVDVGVLLRRNHKEEHGQTRHAMKKKKEKEKAHGGDNHHTKNNLAKTQPAMMMMKVAPLSTSGVILPLSAVGTALSYTEEVSAPGRSKDREFLDRVFTATKDKPVGGANSGGLLDHHNGAANAQCGGSPDHKWLLNPIAALMRFKKQAKQQQQSQLRPGTTSAISSLPSSSSLSSAHGHGHGHGQHAPPHGGKGRAIQATTTTDGRDTSLSGASSVQSASSSSILAPGSSMGSSGHAHHHHQHHHQHHHHQPWPSSYLVSPTKLQPLSLTTALTVGGHHANGSAPPEKHHGGGKRDMLLAMDAKGPVAAATGGGGGGHVAPEASFFFFPGAFHAPGSSDLVVAPAGDVDKERRSGAASSSSFSSTTSASVPPSFAAADGDDEKVFLRGILAPSM